ncbi:hypothetical protein GX50_02352 [[Emmonsia] crescens]|uniref:Uncharacterized protein n=1 Tax=[Emmonsia] crescens TaxID=73230 RepID=A0A2B7ZNN8_9EURO|nr:hypothetical protein GX50_02352 [Emmonsia crescens]
MAVLRHGFQITFISAGAWPEIRVTSAIPGITRECMEHLDLRVLESPARVAQQTAPWRGSLPGENLAALRGSGEEYGLLGLSARAFFSQHGCSAAQLQKGIAQFENRIVDYDDNEAGEKAAPVMRFTGGSTWCYGGLVPAQSMHSGPSSATAKLRIWDLMST